MDEYYTQAALGLVVLIVFLGLRRLFRKKPDYAVIDGSNVMYWVNDEPRVETLRTVIAQLQSVGLVPVIWFDANVGYKLADRYVGPEALAPALGLKTYRVHVAPKGTPADPLLLASARKLGAPVVSNDRFRDWDTQFPELLDAAYMIRGRVRAETITLDVREGLTTR